jgi:DNA-3-methyladenine glycosylase
MFERADLDLPATEVAPRLLGAVFTRNSEAGPVSVRLTEVEAYLGSIDPGSHTFRGLTARTQVIFGPSGHLYTYFIYGMYVCVNLVCSPSGTPSAILLRAGEVVDGIELARSRRPTSKKDADLASGPARLVQALGITMADGGADAFEAPFALTLAEHPSPFDAGPRTGISGAGGTDVFPWRFWIPGDPTVSPYKLRLPKRRAASIG